MIHSPLKFILNKTRSKHTLPDLSFDYGELEPFISAKIMDKARFVNRIFFSSSSIFSNSEAHFNIVAIRAKYCTAGILKLKKQDAVLIEFQLVAHLTHRHNSCVL